MRRVLLVAAILAGLLPGRSPAQERSLTYDLEHVFRDAWFIVSAPTHMREEEAWVALAVAGGTAGLLLVDQPVQDWLRANGGSPVHRVLGAFGESSPLNSLGRTPEFLMPFSLLLYAAGWAADSDDVKDAGLGCATANGTTTVTRLLMSVVLSRARPRVQDGPFRFELFTGVRDWNMRSFPGGHGANIFACTSYWNHRFDLGLAEPALYAVASAVALARIVDEAHWLSDTFAGAAYGHAIGKGVAGRHLERAEQRAAEQSVQPRVYLGWKITFE